MLHMLRIGELLDLLTIQQCNPVIQQVPVQLDQKMALVGLDANMLISFNEHFAGKFILFSFNKFTFCYGLKYQTILFSNGMLHSIYGTLMSHNKGIGVLNMSTLIM
jgi:hypothetical protein